MSPLVDFSPDDINRSKVVPPAFYRVKIESIDQALSKAGDSTNYIIKGRIIKNADSGDAEFAGLATPYWNFNSKAKSFMVGYFAAHGITVESGKRFELNDTIGKELDVFIGNGEYNGAITNQITHQYRAPRAN